MNNIRLFFTSKAMNTLLEKHKRGTYTMVLGFIGGSLVSMFINKDIWDAYPTLTAPHLIIGLVVFVIVSVVFCLFIWKSLNKNCLENVK